MSNGRSYVTSFLTKYNNAAVSEFKKQLGELKKEMSDNKREQKELNKEIRDAEKEIKLINAEIKRTGQTTEEQKKRLTELTASINTDREALEKLKVEQAAIQGKINDTNAAIEKQNKAYDEMVKSMEGAKTAGAELTKQIAAITAAATAAVAGLFAFTSEAALWADDVNTLAAVTGIGTGELQKFMYASDLIDVSVETLSGSLTKLTRSMSTASENADSEAAQAFRELGISITDSTGALRDRQEVFYEAVDALGRIGNETERDALAMDIFGRSAQELNPLIKGGADALKEIGDEAERAGLILSQDALDGLNAFNDKLDLLKSKGTAIKHLAASEMTPALDGLLEVADELLDEINKMVQSGELKKFAKELGEGIKNAANALKNIIKFVLEYKDAIGAAVAAMAVFKAAMSITSLVNSLKIGFKALSIATKAETADMAALNTVMAANPLGLVISLVASLAVGFGTLAASTMNASSEASKYTQELKELIAAENSTIASAQGEAAVLREQYEELQRLGGQTELTSGQKERLASLEETIAGKLGITTQELKDQTGAYRDLSKEIDEYIDRMIEKAKYDYYEKALQKAVEAQLGYYEELKKRYGDATDWYIQMDDQELSEFGVDQEAIKQYHEFESIVIRAKNALYDLGEEAEKTGKKTTSTAAGTEEWGGVLEKTEDAINGIDDALNDTSDGGDSELEKKLTSLNKELLQNQSELRTTKEQLETLRKQINRTMEDWSEGNITIEEARSKMKEYTDEQKLLENEAASLTTKQNGLRNSIKSVKDEISKAAEESKTLEEKLSSLNKTSSSLRSEMSSLANSLKQLEQGEALNLNTVLELTEKYPEYAQELLAAGDNADLQRQALERLFEAKKAEYILTQQSAIDNIEASNKETEAIIENSKKQMKARAMAVGGKWDKDIDEFIERRFASEFEQIKKNNEELEAYKKKIEAVRNIKYSDLATASGSSSSGSGKKDTDTTKKKYESPYTWNYKGETYTATYSYDEGEYDAVKDTDTNAKAYLGAIDRAKNFGRVTLEEEITSLNALLKWENLSADQRYEIRLRLYKAMESLDKERAAAEEEAAKQRADAEKAAAEKAAAAEKEAEEKRLDGQNRALAALRRLVSSKKELLDEEAKAAQDAADKEIAALDKEAEARKRDNDDRKRQQELDRINAKLQYSKLSSFERAELERRRQDILNEQAEVNYERSVEAQKEAIRAGADETVNASEAAKAALDAKYTTISDRVAYLNGTETLDQWAARQPASVALTYVINGLSADQVVAKTRKDIMKELGGVT